MQNGLIPFEFPRILENVSARCRNAIDMNEPELRVALSREIQVNVSACYRHIFQFNLAQNILQNVFVLFYIVTLQ